jgi:hypothetical protein
VVPAADLGDLSDGVSRKGSARGWCFQERKDVDIKCCIYIQSLLWLAKGRVLRRSPGLCPNPETVIEANGLFLNGIVRQLQFVTYAGRSSIEGWQERGPVPLALNFATEAGGATCKPLDRCPIRNVCGV